MSNDAARYSNHHPHVLDADAGVVAPRPGGALRREPVLGLSPGRLRVLRALCEFFVEKRYPPSYREIGERLDRTYSGIKQHVDALVRQGALKEPPHQQSRAHVPTELGWKAAGVTPPAIAQAHPARVLVLPTKCDSCGREYFGDLGAKYHGYGLCWR